MLCCCNLEHHATPWLPNSSQTELIYAADCIISFLMEMDLRNRLPSLLSYVHGPVPLTDDQRTRCFLTRQLIFSNDNSFRRVSCLETVQSSITSLSVCRIQKINFTNLGHPKYLVPHGLTAPPHARACMFPRRFLMNDEMISSCVSVQQQIQKDEKFKILLSLTRVFVW